MSAPKDKPPILVKLSWIAAVIVLVLAIGAGAFIAGYGLAFSKVVDVYAETSVLKAQAAELEAEILHLKNYAVLIDFIATGGVAAGELHRTPLFAPDTVYDTVRLVEVITQIDTVVKVFHDSD